MKYRILKTVLFTCLVALLFSSCKKFLERPKDGQLDEKDAFKTEQDLQNFLVGNYTLLGDGDFLGGRVQGLGEVLADHLEGAAFGGDYGEIFRRRNTFFGGTRDPLYNKGYRIINVANIVLNKLSIATTNRDNIEGQALFFRAIANFELVRLFAQPFGYSPDNSHLGIPLRTTVNLESVPRATVAEVYNQIIADLTKAEGLLPTTEQTGNYWITRWAAKAILAKVYFQMNDFTNAYAKAKEVIDNTKAVLDNLYTSRYSKGLSTEALFALKFETNQYQPGAEIRGNYRSDANVPFFNFSKIAFDFFVNDPSDIRKNLYSSTLQTGFYVTTKFNKLEFDLPIVHLTEIKLILAESGAEIANNNPAALSVAITNLNHILTRAYNGNSRNLGANATSGLVITTARKERELEMVGEGNRYHEIKRIGARNGVNIDRRGSAWDCNGFILQFPKAEQDAMPSFKLNPEGGCF